MKQTKLESDWLCGYRPVTAIGAMAVLLLVSAALIVLFTAEPSDQPLPDFSIFDAGPERKDAFFGYLAPIVREENATILDQRERLQRIHENVLTGGEPGYFDRGFLTDLCNRYTGEEDCKNRVPASDVPMPCKASRLLAATHRVHRKEQ